MKYDDNARLDTSEVTDDRGRSSSAGFGGGGSMGASLLPLLISLAFSRRRGKWFWLLVLLGVGAFFLYGALVPGSAGSSMSASRGGGDSATVDTTQLARDCRTGADANTSLQCAIVADVNSVQDYWGGGAYTQLATHFRGAQSHYTRVDTVFFSGSISTACGSATSSAGPFYCPGDKLVYIDLSFYDDLKTQFHAEGGLLVDAYVLAHEYGHHVQDLLGTEAKIRSREGATSDSVRNELQADCYAGVWMHHATQPQNGRPALISDITQSDINSAIDTAQRIGDDYIQRTLGHGTVDPDTFTHGTSAQRKHWLTVGYRTGNALRCNTFTARDLG